MQNVDNSKVDSSKVDSSKVYFITGGAGFIGYHLSRQILEAGGSVVALDNMNDYYEVSLKEARRDLLLPHPKYTFVQGDISQEGLVEGLLQEYKPNIVMNLAAQAGVRYSITNPEAYMQSNMMGFFRILEACRKYPVEHLVYTSSSSVYGGNTKVPFSTSDPVDRPVSLYAATKKSNELMAYSYSKLYGIKTTGLRFFTVYGPYGRPDMAAFLFTDAIIHDRPIKVFNYGDMKRDFTYVDDIVEGVINVLQRPPLEDEAGVCYRVYNIGNNKPESLLAFIKEIEKQIGKEAIKEFLPMQPGDVYQTYADIDDLVRDYQFRPSTTMEEGIKAFVQWYKEYYGIV